LRRLFSPTVASPIGNFFYLELETGTPYHETEGLVDFFRLGKIIYGKLPVKISFPEIFIEPKVVY